MIRGTRLGSVCHILPVAEGLLDNIPIFRTGFNQFMLQEIYHIQHFDLDDAMHMEKKLMAKMYF